jgi:mRNA interferase MazF
VLVNWRDQLRGSSEPNKRRPGVLVSSQSFFARGFPFEIIVPLTGDAGMAVEAASLLILPTHENGCTKPCYALAWSVQTVPHVRITETPSHITTDELREIRAQISACIGAA